MSLDKYLDNFFNQSVFRFLRRSNNSGSAKITGKPVNRIADIGMEVSCLYEFGGDFFSISWVRMTIEGKKSIYEACKIDRRKRRTSK